jgi:hypothetical protein
MTFSGETKKITGFQGKSIELSFLNCIIQIWI